MGTFCPRVRLAKSPIRFTSPPGNEGEERGNRGRERVGASEIVVVVGSSSSSSSSSSR